MSNSFVKLTFVASDGTATEVDAELGKSVMEAALSNDVVGITAECNGAAACATCHVYFDDAQLNSLPELQTHEDDMLDFATSERKAGSRLSCQIPVISQYAGIEIKLPQEQ